MSVKFELPKNNNHIIKVVGVGGGGSNAVNHMYEQGIKGVDFLVCNTDQQALDISPVPQKIQLGSSLTNGLGAGANSEVGKNAAIENIEEIKELLTDTKMIFITAGMGGGTGTGAAPIIAQAAKEQGILTVGIVTMPFSFEGKKRRRQAEAGVTEMRENVDTILIINNDKLRELFGNLSLDNAFEKADDVLTTAAKGIAETITKTGKINVDFNDVKTVMTDSGVAIMGSGQATGEDRAIQAVEDALISPLLNDNEIRGAEYVLLNITYGNNEVLMDEITEITDFIQDAAGDEAEVIWGHGKDESLDTELKVTVIATGFEGGVDTGVTTAAERAPKRMHLEEPAKPEVQTEAPKSEVAPTESTSTSQGSIFHLTEEEETEATADTTEASANTTEEVTNEATTSEENDPMLDMALKGTEQNNEEKSEEQPAATSEEEPAKKEVIKYSLLDENEQQAEAEKQSNHKADHHENEEAEKIDFTAKKVEKKEVAPTEPTASLKENNMTPEERQKIVNERVSRIRNLSTRWRNPSGISDLESEPAFKRAKIDLDETPDASESNVSKYTLSETKDEHGNTKTDIKSNNSFLHDNVD